jgi:gamma-glutamyltranspeptidase/glutathione hydrolase
MTTATWSLQDVRRAAPSGAEVAVAAARPESVEAALAMLDAGGNAVDAAVACGFVAGVVEPMDTCVSGSGFMLISDPSTGEDLSVEFPPRAPLAATPDMFEVVSSEGAARLLGVSVVAGDANAEGVLASGVPGTVAGLLAAHERLGRLPRAQVLEPAIRAAADGFAVDAYYALHALDHLDHLHAQPAAAAIFLDERGRPPVPAFLGATTLGVPPRLRQPDLARTLEIVAARGRDGYYAGEVAAAIERHFAAHGGLITRADLERYRPIVTEPLRGAYRGAEILAPTSPSGALTELQILRALERFPAGRDADALHVLAEVSRAAFADRYHWLGDPDFVDVPLAGLLSDGHADATAARVRAGTPAPRADGLPWEVFAFHAAADPWAHDPGEARAPYAAPGRTAVAADHHGTTHFAVADGDGMTVSCTHTAGNAFGSKVVAEGTGLLFDAAMVWFNATPGAANSIAPGKRPLVNMGPLVLKRDGRPFLGIGAPGGRRIINALVQVVTGVVDGGLAVQDAIGAPRLDASGAALLASERLGAATLDGLRERGHDVVAVREQHEPFTYEFARPVGVEIAPDGTRRAGVDPFTVGHAAAR